MVEETWKKIILGSVGGAIVSGLTLILGGMYQQEAWNTMATTGVQPTGVAIAEILMLAGIFLGGFIAAFIAKGGREALANAISASFFSGLLVSLGIILQGILTPEEQLMTEFSTFYQQVSSSITMETAFYYWVYQMVWVLVAFSVFVVILSVLGGLASAYLTKSRESIVVKVFGELKQRFSLALVVPPVVFMFLAMGMQVLDSYGMEALGTSGILDPEITVTLWIIFSMLVTLLLVAFAVSASVLGTKNKKNSLMENFRSSIRESKEVFVSLLVFYSIIPGILALLISIIQELPVWSYTVNMVMFFFIVTVLVIGFYLFFACFTAPIALLEKKYLRSFVESVKFVKNNFPQVVAFDALMLIVMMIVLLIDSYLPQVDIITPSVSGLLMGLLLVFLVGGQTILYKKVKG